MDLSIIIPTWNNAARLRITLASFAAARRPGGPWEVIVVNNNCTDGTDEVLGEYVGPLPLRAVHEHRQGLSFARNAGLEAATGRLAVFADDDVEVVPEWMEVYRRAFAEHPEGHFFGGPIVSDFAVPVDPELLPLAPFSVRGWDFGPERTYLRVGQHFLGANWAAPTDALRRVGAFDPDHGLNPQRKSVRAGEESELMDRLREEGFRGLYLPEASLSHWVPAEKCTPRHVGDRAQAAAAYAIRVAEQPPPGRYLFGAPRWMYREALSAWWAWARRRLAGAKAYRQYVAYRGKLGRIEAARERRRLPS
jgi:glycosyltransferase involved in cell wall biosynthesis